MIIAQSADAQAIIRAYVTLSKPRIIMMLLFTALGGLFLASGGVPDLLTTIWVLVGGTLASAGANAINQSMDRDIDEAMRRTATRPVVVGLIPSHHAIIFGIAVNIASFVMLAGLVNMLSAVLTIGATLFYVLVYTKALKRSTTQNIVIGGAAGALPPMIGWTAVTGSIDLPAIYLFAIIFFWTPPHFWALALMLKDDYARAKVPMLPVVAGIQATKKSILLYTVLMLALTTMFYATAAVGLIYLVFSAAAGIVFVYYAWRLIRRPEIEGAKALYLYSLLYLAVLFTAIIADSLVKI